MAANPYNKVWLYPQKLCRT